MERLDLLIRLPPEKTRAGAGRLVGVSTSRVRADDVCSVAANWSANKSTDGSIGVDD